MKTIKIERLGSINIYRRFVRGLLAAGGERVRRGVYRVPSSCVPGGAYSDGRAVVVGGASGVSQPGRAIED